MRVGLFMAAPDSYHRPVFDAEPCEPLLNHCDLFGSCRQNFCSVKTSEKELRTKGKEGHNSTQEQQFRRNTLPAYFLYSLLIQAKHFFGSPLLCHEKAFITLNAVSGSVSACNSAVYHHSKSEKHRKIRLINTTAVCLTLHSGKAQHVIPNYRP